MKVNHFVCPNCGHDCYDTCAYTTCDACQCFFYASQSKTCQPRPRTIYGNVDKAGVLRFFIDTQGGVRR